MIDRIAKAFWIMTLAGSCAGLTSCSGASESTTQAGEQSAPATDPAPGAPPRPFTPPTVSIGAEQVALLDASAPADDDLSDEDDADDEGSATPDAEPEKGSAEWLIREITLLNSAPLDRIRQPIPGKPGEFKEVELNDQQAQEEQRRRAEKIVELALEACTKTKGDAKREQIFNNSVHYLAMARTTLALAGDVEQVKLLGDEVETLFKLNNQSFATIDSHLKLVELLQKLAAQHGRSQPQWGQAAARQARLFATRFPQDSSRAAMALLTAARACESGGQFDAARDCYLTLQNSFGNTPFAEQAAGSLRRYQLTGKKLDEFAGATIDGGYLSIDQFRGQTVVIAFWSAGSQSFKEDLPRIEQAVSPFAKDTLTLIGVNLDVDLPVVDSYLENVNLPFRTIFFANPEQRGLRNPIARFYSVTTVPQYWVVDAKGTVVAAPTDIQGLETQLKKLAPK